MPDEPRDPLSVLLDVVVYAPIGAFFHGTEAVTELAQKGRGQVANARVVGRLAIQRGRDEAERWVASMQTKMPDGGQASAGAAEDSSAADVAFEDLGDGSSLPQDDVGSQGADDRPEPPSALSLPIPDYDALSASQVMPRLDDLGGDELDAVRDYERAHRGRMTILSRIAQLRAN